MQLNKGDIMSIELYSTIIILLLIIGIYVDYRVCSD